MVRDAPSGAPGNVVSNAVLQAKLDAAETPLIEKDAVIDDRRRRLTMVLVHFLSAMMAGAMPVPVALPMMAAVVAMAVVVAVGGPPGPGVGPMGRRRAHAGMHTGRRARGHTGRHTRRHYTGRRHTRLLGQGSAGA